MALSMDEQRMLAEIERRLSAEDPRLAARLSSFRRPGPAATLRTPRGRIIGSVFTVVLVAVVSMMVYAMVPFRAHGAKSTSSPQASNSAPAHSGPPSVAANTSAAANSGTAVTSTASAPSTAGGTSAPAGTQAGTRASAGPAKTVRTPASAITTGHESRQS